MHYPKIFSLPLLACPLLLCLLLLSACSQTPKRTPLSTSHTFQSSPVPQAFELKGKIGYQQGKEGGSVQSIWAQQGRKYQITLIAPTGTDRVLVKGKPNFVEVISSDGEKLTHTSAEALTQEKLGWSLPITGLRYWMFGQPIPHHSVANIDVHQANGHIHQFKQLDWQVTLDNYRKQGQYLYPKRVLLQRDDLKVKVVITQRTID